MAANQRGAPPMNLVVEAVASMLAKRITEIGASIGLAPPVSDEPSSAGPAPAPADDRPGRGRDRDDEPEEPGDLPLPIASYDSLTAREIIGLLDELDDGQLARIRAHEEANRARKTVLGKLDRLSA